MADLDDVTDLLALGFAGRSRDYWIDGLRRMSVRETPEAFPRFGYMLDYDGRPVGALADYVACAGAIGRFLLLRGRISVALDANGRIDGLVGLYREPLGRKYFKGPQRPRLADLTDTELVPYGP